MNLQEFIKKYNGKGVDWDGKYSGQCVDLFRQYCNDVLNISQPKGVVGAKDFWTNYESDPNLKNNFKKIKNTKSLVVEGGDVVIWGVGVSKYGHIAIGIEGDVDRFTSFDQNWKALNVSEVIKHDYKSVLGVLRPKTPLKNYLMPSGDVDWEFANRKGYKTFGEAVDGAKEYREEREDYKNTLEEYKDHCDKITTTLEAELRQSKLNVKRLSENIKIIQGLTEDEKDEQIRKLKLQLTDKIDQLTRKEKVEIAKRFGTWQDKLFIFINSL